MKRGGRLSDFAGVALVDILANGLAMLIIVIVLTIAARTAHEERTSAQVEEVETMMSRRFSTSLVLNSLAASPPARLHDYRTSPLDQDLDPFLLPILELHREFVREFYDGAVWSRKELLHEPNAMDAWLAGFDEIRKRRLRVDVYDVAQFYLAMSILRDHDISVRHWHFLEGGGLALAGAARCPPGVAAQDCAAGAGDAQGAPALPSLAAQNDGVGGADAWPPGFTGQGAGGGELAQAAPFPGGAALGDGAPPGSGSFPNARPDARGGRRGLLDADAGWPGAGEVGLRFRLSGPESLRPQGGQPLDRGALTPERILTVLLDYIGNLQTTLDVGASPSAQLANFERIIGRGLAAPPLPDEQELELIRALLADLARRAPRGSGEAPALRVIAPSAATPAGDALVVPANRRLREVAVRRPPGDKTPPPPDAARPVLRLNLHPDVWRGLSLTLEPDAILLLPPRQRRPQQARWRAVAYIAPDFDDFIIGFAYAAVTADGRLVARAEDNRVRLDGRPLHAPPGAARFGARSWLVTLYAGLVLGLFGLLLVVRRPAGGRRP